MGKAPNNTAKRWQGKKEHDKKLAKYVSRQQALNIVKLPLSRFRELCILRGVSPRIPPFESKKTSKVFYLRDDIRYLAADPLVNKFRQWRIFLLKLRKMHDKKEIMKEKGFIKNAKPTFTYDHLIKHRYPTFQSALSDLDDCLSLVFLFSKMPAGAGIDTKLIQKLKRLVDEFCSYIVKTRALRKVFISVKGIYYQASIMNQDVSWIVPFDFPQKVSPQVNFAVFKTFLNFHSTLLGFINFKLYHSLSLSYPPQHNPKMDTQLSNLLNLIEEDVQLPKQETIKSQPANPQQQDNIASLQSAITSIAEKNAPRREDNLTGDDDDDLLPQEETEEQSSDPETVFLERFKNLFKGLVIFVNRECPRISLEFVIRAFGGEVAFDSPDSKYKRDDSRITHEIVDRPELSGSANENREYVQPQWVYDSINARIRLPVEPYKYGRKLPPHLSPFVEYDELTYVPKYAEEIRKLVANELDTIRSNLSGALQSIHKVDDDAPAEEDEEEDEQEAAYYRELEAEKQGLTFAKLQEEIEKSKQEKEISIGAKPKKTAKEQKEDELNMMKASLLSMTKKSLYTRAKRDIEQKKEKMAELMSKRMRMEMGMDDRELDSMPAKERGGEVLKDEEKELEWEGSAKIGEEREDDEQEQPDNEAELFDQMVGETGDELDKQEDDEQEVDEDYEQTAENSKKRKPVSKPKAKKKQKQYKNQQQGNKQGHSSQKQDKKQKGNQKQTTKKQPKTAGNLRKGTKRKKK